MIGTKLYKNNFTDEQYSQCAEWCNETQLATIEEKGDFYEVVEILDCVPTEAEIKAQITAAVQDHMDETAQTRGYDNINTACTYVNSTDHIFAAEGIACVKWRDGVWRKYFDVLAEIEAGTRALPTVEEILEELPVLEW